MSAKKDYYDRKTKSPSPSLVEMRNEKFRKALATGDYDVRLSFFAANGGNLLFHKGRKFDQDEYDAAMYLALDGAEVELTPESGDFFTLRYTNSKGEIITKYGDGKVSGVIYEQKTTDSDAENFNFNVRKAINHAFTKGVTTALIYDPHGLLHRYNIKKGMEDYKKYNKSKYDKVSRVCVINNKGEVYWWHWE